MRAAVLALAALLACSRLGGGRGDDDEREVRIAGEPMTDAQQARLRDHARAGGLLWWRLPGPAGPRCEAWKLVPDPADPEHGRLVLVPGQPAPSDIPTGPEGHAPEDIQTGPEGHAPEDISTSPPSPDPSDSPMSPSPPVRAGATPSGHTLADAAAAPGSTLLAAPTWSAVRAASPSPAPSDSLASPLLAAPTWSAPRAASPSLAPSDSLASPLLAAPTWSAARAWPLPPAAPDPPSPGEPSAVSPSGKPAPSDMPLGPATMRLGYRLSDGHLTLTAPEHERPAVAPPGTQKTVGRALTCVFTGVALSGPTGAARRLILAARERLFFTQAACDAAGFAEDTPGPDELRALGCAGALADPATRARLERPPPRDAPDAAARLHRARAVHHLRRGADGRLVCDVWRNRPERLPGHGRLEHRGRDERGRFVRAYAYDVGPGYLTLQGPAEFRRVDLAGQRTDVVRASSCLVTRDVTGVAAAALDLGGERWYLSKRACDAARISGAPAPLGSTPLLVSECE